MGYFLRTLFFHFFSFMPFFLTNHTNFFNFYVIYNFLLSKYTNFLIFPHPLYYQSAHAHRLHRITLKISRLSLKISSVTLLTILLRTKLILVKFTHSNNVEGTSWESWILFSFVQHLNGVWKPRGETDDSQLHSDRWCYAVGSRSPRPAFHLPRSNGHASNKFLSSWSAVEDSFPAKPNESRFVRCFSWSSICSESPPPAGGCRKTWEQREFHR